MKQLSKKKIKDRRKRGIVKAYMSRAAAIKKLQISLADFRRLCILKGIYPVEPKNKSKLTGANTRRKTYFFTKDIQFLMNEPLLFKFWEFKIFMKRLSRAKGRHDKEKFDHVNDSKPIYQLDSLVKERYPRFTDALRDCDDALSMCFLFAMFPKARNRPDDLIDLSRKLTLEFMHYVIHTKSLRKVFISIKGYYYQADIMGQRITWVVPHQFVIDKISNVDMNVMKTFTEFYVTLLGFINYKLYTTINANYPPQITNEKIENLIKASAEKPAPKKQIKRKVPDDDEEEDYSTYNDTKNEMIATLNKNIKVMDNKSVVSADKSEQQPDVFEEIDQNDKENPAIEKKEQDDLTVQQVMALEKLFDGSKFFLSREVPRESLTFVLRSFGGEVSWDKALFPGATYAESDPSITHQVVDRSNMDSRHLNRIYIQPQWVYDCINMRMLLPTDDYLVGATLPPHLSPFVNEKRGDYIPPDKIKMMNLRQQFEAEKASEEKVSKGEAGIESELETDTEFEKEIDDNSDEESDSKNKIKRRATMDPDGKPSRLKTLKNQRKRERDSNKSTSRSKMVVKQGKFRVEDKEELKKQEEAEHRKMGIMMIPKKKKRLFDKITKTQRQKKKKVDRMRAKRKIVDAVKARPLKSDKKFAHKTQTR